MLQKAIILLMIFVMCTGMTNRTFAHHPQPTDKRQLFEMMETFTQIPWYYTKWRLINLNRISGKTTNRISKKRTPISSQYAYRIIGGRVRSIPIQPYIPHFHPIIPRHWPGWGWRSKKADPTNAIHVLYSLSQFLVRNGTSKDHIREQLWKYYQHPTTVDIITHTAEIFRETNRLELDEKRFPIPLQYNYTYRSTWGDRRGWGGVRIHEGTDIFADYGTPVLSNMSWIH